MNFVLESSIRMVLIAVAVAAVTGGLRITNARASHRAWTGVLLAMLLLPPFMVWAPKATLRVLPAAAAVRSAWIPAEIPAEVGQPAAPARTAPEAAAAPRATPNVLLEAYLVGVAVLLIRLAMGTARGISLVKRAVVEDGFLSSAECVCPLAMGWRRPAVVLPSSWRLWKRRELDAVLAHEREHARQRDPLVQWLAAVNRCIFWFHPLAWWLERKLSTLAEEACDAAVLAQGHDPAEYSEYLLNQARAIEEAGGRLLAPGMAMGAGALARRIRRLLDGAAAPEPSRRKAALAALLCGCAALAATACNVGRAERPAPGQPTMNELMHRRAEQNQQWKEKNTAIAARARSVSPEEAKQLLAKLKENPQDQELHSILVAYYQLHSDVSGLDSMVLWYIENRPDGKIWPSRIIPGWDKAGYERGKQLWLANTKRPGATTQVYQRAADYLDAGDQPLAGQVLEAGRNAHPNESSWAGAFGRHFARVLSGSAGGADSAYVRSVRARLNDSRDVALLLSTAESLTAETNGFQPNDPRWAVLELAREYTKRALAIEPGARFGLETKARLDRLGLWRREAQLEKMPPAEIASDSDRMVLLRGEMNKDWLRGKENEAGAKARELLELARRNPSDPLYGDAVFEANMLLGKIALHAGDKAEAVRYLRAAAETPGSDEIQRGYFVMNLPRALVDWGERSAAADFLERMAPKTRRAKELRDWAAQIRRGINPDLTPTMSMPGCSKDPC